MKKINLHYFFIFFPLLCLFDFFAQWKINYIFGSHNGFFTANALFGPMIGIFAGTYFAIFAIFVRTLLRMFLGLSNPFTYLLYHIPGLCAVASWRSSSTIINLGIPFLCMFLFWLHPVGLIAWPYACYWIIPIAISASRKQNIFLKSVTSTFVAHAVGSVLWIYTINMSAVEWYALIPIVFFERLFFAIGMTVSYHIFVWLRSHMKQEAVKVCTQ